jgi:toxin YoeB
MDEVWSTRAEADYFFWKSEDRRMKARIDRLVDAIKSGKPGIRPFRLRDDLEGWFAQEIAYGHFLVYSVRDGKLLIASCRYLL